VAFRDEGDRGPKDSSNTLTHKKFPGGVLSLTGANSGTGLRRISRRVIFLDEVDAYPSSAGSDGDPVELAAKRSEAFWNRKIVAGSTPLLAGHSRIEELFKAGDRRRYHVPCPHCRRMDFLVFREKGGEELGDRGHYMKFDAASPEKAAASAHFMCRGCGCEIEHKHKQWMIERGEWRGDAPFTGHASFHLWAAYSYSPGATWGKIAAEFVKANAGGPEKLRTFVNTTLGETWHEKGEAPEWRRLYERREGYEIGTAPAGVKLITAGVDVQKDRLVWEVVGWGEDRQSWSLDADVIMGDTSSEAPWLALDELLGRTFPKQTGEELPISVMAVDSGFASSTVYGWARRHPGRVIATKGSALAPTLLGTPKAVDVMANGKRAARGCKVWIVGVSSAKAEFYGWLRLPMPNKEAGQAFPPGYCHFPEHGEDYFKQITAEQRVSVKTRNGFPRLEWQLQPGRENHWLDCRVYARAAAYRAGLDRMRRAAPTAPAAPNPSAPQEPAPPAPPQREPAPRSAPRDDWLGGRGGNWFR
jgi:phage terminase large subunit GpA-like protein